MIDVTDTELVEWLTTVVAPAPVSLGPPPSESDTTGVACHLLSLLPVPVARGNRRAPVQAVARYLVTAWAPEPIDAHRLLGQMVVAAADHAELDLEGDEPDLALWSALGLRPQPALVMRAPVRWPRPEAGAPLVREPLRVQFHDITPLVGAVVSPGGTPIARAEVRVPGVDVPVWTDRTGAFVVPGAPADDVRAVTVTARGLVRTLAVTPGSPLNLVFDPEPDLPPDTEE